MEAKLLNKLIKEFKDMDPSPQDIINNYTDASDFDKCVILLRSYKMTYGQISAKMGSPSKKIIRASLLKWAPELIEEDCNRSKLKPKERASKEEFTLINIIRKFPNKKIYFIDDYIGNWEFQIKDGRLFYIEDGKIYAFSDFDFICQTQVLQLIKNQVEWD